MEDPSLVPGSQPLWYHDLKRGVQALVSDKVVRDNVHFSHLRDTPTRVANFYSEFLWGYYATPAEALATTSGDVGFEEGRYDQMVMVVDIDFVSLCSHHLLPFIGKAHFGYLPDKRVVGLSKMPRLIDVFSHRLQLQEQLTQQVVVAFQEEVAPKGCGLVMEAEHLCMTIRGVQRPGSVTVTSALSGCFKDDPSVKEEFLQSIAMRRKK
jgi:GTP cyclohydrolase I